MAFYVPLGVRGFLFNVGTLLIGVSGSMVYWWASRRRELFESPLILSFDLPDLELLPLTE